MGNGSLTRPFLSIHRVLNIKENKFRQFQPVEMINSFQYTIEKLDISGDENTVVDLHNLRK